jgi:4-hydroxy-2-oxoheptanedioate aldolase
MKVNTAKRRMLEGKPAIGAAVGLGSPMAAEIYSLQGYDFVLVDGQHGNWDLAGMTAAFRNTAVGTAVPMARVQKNDFFAIGSLLDRGAMGIVVPMVNSNEQAETAAFAARFPPHGGRSWGGFGTSLHQVADYRRWIDEELFLAVQIETKEAVERAEEILSVDGVDGCWIGPADLALSLGVDVSTPAGYQQHEESIMQVLSACRATGKIPGIAGGIHGERWLEKGFLFVTCASDSAAISEASADILARLQHYR